MACSPFVFLCAIHAVAVSQYSMPVASSWLNIPAVRYLPVLCLCLLDVATFALIQRKSRESGESCRLTLIGTLFFFSGFPALIYQVVWQRTLFLIYGVNVETVAVVVAAFMLGLGVGSLVGGQVSKRFPNRAILLFGVAELGIALFGVCSLPLFHVVARYTAAANLGSTVLLCLVLLLVPTILMGSTLPLLVTHLVRTSRDVGFSVAALYFVNTLGSAVACYVAAAFLMRSFGQSGSVIVAACFNSVVGASALIYAYRRKPQALWDIPPMPSRSAPPSLSLPFAAMIAGVSGFISLGFEILWFRVYSLATGGRAPAFALLLATFLAGIAGASFAVERWLMKASADKVRIAIGALLTLGGILGYFVIPFTAWLVSREYDLLTASPVYYLVAGLIGAVLPLACRLALPPDEEVGRGVSLVYVSNIIGSTLGSLVVGFILMDHFSLPSLSAQLTAVAIVSGIVIQAPWKNRAQATMCAGWLLSACVLFLSGRSAYSGLYERLILHGQQTSSFVHIVENKHGEIAVTDKGVLFGGGMYDGRFNVDPVLNSNGILRAYAVSAFHPSPTRVLMIGLASGSWAQVIVHNPHVEMLDIVEINPGYLELIPKYPAVSSLLQNPKVHVFIDDGRRWLTANRDRQYDFIVMNTTYHWRDHTSALLSTEFLHLAQAHLSPGGILFYNTTDGPEVYATGLKAFGYGLRVGNFLAVSDRPLEVNRSRWEAVMRDYRVDGRPIFDLSIPDHAQVLKRYIHEAEIAEQTGGSPDSFFEQGSSLLKRVRGAQVINDDNMGVEWK